MERGRGPGRTWRASVLQEEVEDREGEQPEDRHHRGRGSPASARQRLRARLEQQRRGAPAPRRSRPGSAAAAPSSGTIRSRARVWTASAPTSVPDHRDARRRPAAARRAARAAPGPGEGSEQQHREGRHGHELAARRGSRTARSPWPRTARCGRPGASRKPSKPPSSRSATNSRLIAEHRGEQQRHPQHAGGEVALERLAVEPEVEEHEGRDAENSAIAGTDSRVRSSSRRSLRISARHDRARGRRRSSRRAPAPPPPRRAARGASSAWRPPRSPSTRSASASPASTSWEMSTRVAPAAAGRSAARPRPRRRVEVGERLVEQQQLGLVQHGAADRHALDHAARERAHRLVGAARQPDRVEHAPPTARRARRRAAARGSAGSRAR